MCGRYASSRRPEDLAEEFEIDRGTLSETLAGPLEPDYNVAPTKPVYAVARASPGPTARDGEDAAHEDADGRPPGGASSG